MRNKYNAKKTVVDGIVFDSRAEGWRYTELKLLQRAGHISGLWCQPQFEVVPKQKNERGVVYIADFMYTENERTVVEDVKSEITRKNADYIIKRKLFKQKFPEIIFREIVR